MPAPIVAAILDRHGMLVNMIISFINRAEWKETFSLLSDHRQVLSTLFCNFPQQWLSVSC